MKKLIFLIGFLLLSGPTLADEGDTDLIKKVQSLADLTAQVTIHEPSILLSSPDDRRIDKLADSQSQAFLVRSEGSTPFVAIINTKKKHGILWWKKAVRLVFHGDRWSKLEKGNESLNSEERLFIQEL